MAITVEIRGGKDLAKRMVNRVAGAVNGAFSESAANIQAKGRADIAKTYGHMGRMAQAWVAVKGPKNKGLSLEPYVHGYHKASYAGIFEAGQTTEIHPLMRRFLWIPVPNSPAAKLYRAAGAGGAKLNAKTGAPGAGVGAGAGKLGPAAIAFKLGLPLVPIIRPGKPPLLGVVNARISKGGRFLKSRGPSGKVNLKQSGFTPLFFGVPRVEIVGRWKVRQIGIDEFKNIEQKIAVRLEK
jgi:hypothetical protein